MLQLKKRRGVIKAQMTRLVTFVNGIVAETSIDNIKTRLNRTNELLHEFNDVEDKIFAISDKEESEIEEFEEGYYHVLAELNGVIRQRTMHVIPKTHDETAGNISVTQGSSEFKLPRISMRHFDGNYRDYQSFMDLFTKVVHDNPNISPAQKFQYLKGLLEGKAEAVVKHLPVTDGNYIDALQLLKTRFNRKKNIISSFIELFMNHPTIKQADTYNVRKFVDIYNEVTGGLRAMGPQAEQRDHWLIYIAKQKLDEESRQLWSNESTELEFPSDEDFIKFLNKRADALEGNSSKTSYSNKNSNNNKVKAFYSNSEEICSCCKLESHSLVECRKFKTLSVEDRRKHVKDSKKCYNCMSSSHPVFRCKSRFKCNLCKRRHNSLLHIEESELKEQVNANFSNTVEVPVSCKIGTLNNKATTNDQINNTKHIILTTLLPTAVVKVKDASGEYQLCRVLLDSGSQLSFMTESCIQRLRLPRVNARLSVSGIGAKNTINSRGRTDIEVTSRFDDLKCIEFSVYILSKITSNLPTVEFDKDNWNFIKGIDLADAEFNVPKPIDILIGSDQIFRILKGDQIVRDKYPIAQYTLFGWVLAGGFHNNSTSHNLMSAINMHVGTDIDRSLRKFWESEEVPSAEIWNTEEKECENHFQKNVSKDHGKYIVRLPFKNEEIKVGDTLGLSVKRLKAMERRFEKDETFKTSYIQFMREYESLGHMVELLDSEIDIDPNKRFYLPHHGVSKETSSTAKLRVVFDASAKIATGSSLNDNLMIGPTIQPSLLNILLRFRVHRIVFTADIEKMYRQILVDDKDVNYQRIVWRESCNSPIKHYKLRTVTYGTACAPFLATRVLQQVASDTRKDHPDISKTIEEDFYVDDLLSGVESDEMALTLKENLVKTLADAGFNLRKWSSNSTNLLQSIPEKDKEGGIIEIGEDTIKILGLQWQPAADDFGFKIQLDEKPSITKRAILSEAARIFDPLGWLSPTAIMIKIFFQELWLLNLEWDDNLPNPLRENWLKLRNQIEDLQQIKIPRWLNTKGGTIELHGFSDASEKDRWKEVVYCRVAQEDGTYAVNIVAAKTKVAPIQQVSLPRLELCGAALLAKLLNVVKEPMKVENQNIFAWTDSTIVLSWLSSHPSRWKTYVANRVGQILRITSRNQWNHVRSCNNPADCSSRGILPSVLKSHALWWHGPLWLSQSRSKWPIVNIQEEEQQGFLEEERISKSVLIVKPSYTIYDETSSTISSYNKMIRVLAWINRFIHNYCCKKKDRVKTNLTSTDLKDATIKLIRYIQGQHYSDEIKLLRGENSETMTSSLKMLSPILDENGIMRVGGRIQNSAAPFEVKHPIILPGNNEIVVKMIMEEHKRNFHAGASLLFNTLRQRHWIVGCRNAVRRIIHNCVICTRFQKNVIKQQMGSLPEARVEYERPFLKTGIDYAGPIMVKNSRGRGQHSHKAYIAIFVCMSTKAIHIELVNELTSESFLGALRRFVSRRGICTDMFSDNGSNFIGANRILLEFFKFLKLNNNKISSSLLKEHITWHFIPPAAPHFGGIWESAVKSMKFHLRRVIGNSILTFEEMSTLLSQIEAILNSRPICSTSTEEIDCLTPGHFLIGHPYNFVPEPDIQGLKLSSLSRWQMVQQIVQHFWTRWQREYLTGLQKRNKWQTKKENLKVDDIVIVKEENLPPTKWMLGKIVDVHTGNDGLVRVPSIKVSSGIIKRPVSKLCLLPVEVIQGGRDDLAQQK